MKILLSILAIQQEIHAVGIGKTRKNVQQGFNFRGIDDALAAFAPLLTNNKVILSPSYSDVVMTERETAKGGKMYNVTLAGRFRFTHAEDGSTYEVGPFYGEASDSGDKAVSKAESVAERQMFFLSFVVPHEPAIGGDPDGLDGGDSGTYDITQWADAIENATDMTELNKIGADLKGRKDEIPPAAMRNIRALWSRKSKGFSA